MNTLVLLSCCPGHSVTDWSPIINALPCIFWGIIALFALYFLLKLVVSPLITNCHELKVKDVKNKHEEALINNKEIKESELKQKDNDLEIEKLKISLAQKKLKVYEDFYDKLEFGVRLKDESNKEHLARAKAIIPKMEKAKTRKRQTNN